MGLVINFPEARRVAREGHGGACESATIMILPVVRIERSTDLPPDDEASSSAAQAGRKRRRRAPRS